MNATTTTKTTKDKPATDRKAKTRGNGEGSAYYDASKRLYCYAAKINGTRITQRGKTKKEARDKWQKRNESAIRSPHQKIGTSCPILGDWLETWCAEHAPTIRYRTQVCYKTAIKTHIPNDLKSKRLVDVTPADIVIIQNRLTATHSYSIVNQVRVVLKMAFEFARQSRIVTSNPVHETQPPRKPARHIQLLTLDQTRTFLTKANGPWTTHAS